MGGTTELTITPCTSRGSSSFRVKRLRMSTPYSSTVCMRAVVSRQCATSSSPRKTPSTVLVLPTSMVKSILAGLRTATGGVSRATLRKAPNSPQVTAYPSGFGHVAGDNGDHFTALDLDL